MPDLCKLALNGFRLRKLRPYQNGACKITEVIIYRIICMITEMIIEELKVFICMIRDIFN